MEEENKKITITGINNKYQIKKVKKEFYIHKKRKETNKWNIDKSFFIYEKQIEIIKQLQQNNLKELKETKELEELEETKELKETKELEETKETEEIEEIKKIFKQQINKKIAGYKNQDNVKNIFDNIKFIDIYTILQKMVDCNLKCYFCNCEMLIIYELTREMKQWTIDRINNELGHNNNNFIITCLDCNLKRKNKKVDNFLFTKQLNIIKMD